MSKRRKENGEEEEDKPFKMPTFDEAAFLKRERRNIKTTFISFLFGCLMALICFCFWALIGKNDMRWWLVFLVGIVNASFLKFIFLKLNIDLADFRKMNWFSSFAIYFFTWLIVFIVIINPPFYDDEAPLVDLVVLPEMQEPGGSVFVLAKITDNSGMKKENIQFEITYPDGAKESPDFDYNDKIFNYTFSGPTNFTEDEIYNYTLIARDPAGHTTTKTGSFTYSNNTIFLATPNSGDTVETADDVKFYVGADVSRVYYTIDSTEINATKSDREEYYTTNPGFKGWPRDENITLIVKAEIIYYFENIIDDQGRFVQYKNTIIDADNYNLKVADESTIGQKESPPVTLPSPRITYSPGFELILFIISVVIIVLILKYNKKKKRNKK